MVTGSSAEVAGGPVFVHDVGRIFLARFLRLFAFGSLSVVLALYLAELGVTPWRIGLLLACALAGDTVLSLGLSASADRLGRRRVLAIGGLLMALAGTLLASGDVYVVLLVGATVGIVSPAGQEAGPFLPVEQAALAGYAASARRARLFGWYHLVGALGTAFGALAAGWLVSLGQSLGLAGAAAYRPVLAGYVAVGLLVVACCATMSPAIEAGAGTKNGVVARSWGLNRSRRMVMKLSALFAMDAFGGGMVMQSALAWWLNLQFGATPAALGALFFGCNLLSGISYLAAGWISRRIGLLNTMVFTHLPANLMLMMVPFMPTFAAAAAVLVARATITQMDVPTRQAYLLSVVDPEERSAAGGLTAVARSIGGAFGPPAMLGLVGGSAWAGMPFLAAGALKAAYDVLLYRGFRRVKPEHELSSG